MSARTPVIYHVIVAVPALRRIVVLAPVLTVVREYLDRLTLCQTTHLMACQAGPVSITNTGQLQAHRCRRTLPKVNTVSHYHSDGMPH